jgi:hypothetical protein
MQHFCSNHLQCMVERGRTGKSKGKKKAVSKPFSTCKLFERKTGAQAASRFCVSRILLGQVKTKKNTYSYPKAFSKPDPERRMAWQARAIRKPSFLNAPTRMSYKVVCDMAFFPSFWQGNLGDRTTFLDDEKRDVACDR